MINKAAKKIIISTDKTLEKLNIKKNLRPSEISKDKYYKLIKYVI